MFEFAKEQAAKEEWQDKIATHMESMEALKLDQCGVASLHAVVKDMHYIMDGFRKRSIEDVIAKVTSSCKTLAGLALEEHDVTGAVPVEVLESLEMALQEASSLMPEALGLADAVAKLNEKMHANKHAEQIQSCLQACNELLVLGKPCEGNKDELTRVVGVLNDLALDLLEPLPVPESDRENVSKCWKRLIEIFEQRYMGEEEEMVGMNQVTNLLYTLPRLLSTKVPGSGKLTECLEWAQDYLDKMKGIKEKLEGQAHPQMMETLRTVRRCQIKVEHAKKTWSEQPEICDECSTAWKSFISKYEGLVKEYDSIVGALQNEVRMTVEKACNECKNLAGGKKNGALWTEGLKPNLKWSSLQSKYKDGQLFDMTVIKQLATSMDSLVEAAITRKGGCELWGT